MTTLYQIQRTTAGKSTVEETPKELVKAQAYLASIAFYMQRQGAKIVLSSPDSFTMSMSRVVTRYDLVPAT